MTSSIWTLGRQLKTIRFVLNQLSSSVCTFLDSFFTGFREETLEDLGSSTLSITDKENLRVNPSILDCPGLFFPIHTIHRLFPKRMEKRTDKISNFITPCTLDLKTLTVRFREAETGTSSGQNFLSISGKLAFESMPELRVQIITSQGMILTFLKIFYLL